MGGFARGARRGDLEATAGRRRARIAPPSAHRGRTPAHARAALRAQPHDRAAAAVRRRSSRWPRELGIGGGRDPQRPRRQRHPRRHAARRGSRALAEAAGVRILSINALQRFDDWRAPRPTEAATLADYAAAPAAPRRWCWCRATTAARAATGCTAALEGAARRSSRARGLDRAGRAARLRDLLAAAEVGGGRRRSTAIGGQGTLPPGARHLPPPPRRRGRALPGADRARAHLRRRRPGAARSADMRDAHRGLVTARGPAREHRADPGASAPAATTGSFSFEPFAAEVQALDRPGRGDPAQHGPSRDG